MKSKHVKFDYDPAVDAAYLTLGKGKVLESEQVEPGLVVDFGQDDKVLGVEILRFSRRFMRESKVSSKSRRLAS